MSSHRRPRIPSDEWERHKAAIRGLYLDERRKLEGQNGVIDTMQKIHGFVARSVNIYEPLNHLRTRVDEQAVKLNTRLGSRGGTFANTRRRKHGRRFQVHSKIARKGGAKYTSTVNW
jgi:hypothetical protein